MYYFAYGSNMSSLRLLARVPSARMIAVGHLAGYQMSFRKHSHDGSSKCTLEQKKGSSVLGVVYKIPADQRYTLDRIEGQGFGYAVSDVDIMLQSGDYVRAFTYVGTDLTDDLKPYAWYKYHVMAGAREHGLTEQYIRSIEAVEDIEDPDEERQRYELSIYQLDSA